MASLETYLNYQHITLALLTISWCFTHSIMIAPIITNHVKKFPVFSRWYRILFNLISLVTLILLIMFKKSIYSENIFLWDGGFLFIQISLICSGVVLLSLGTLKYDARRFFGFTQLKEAESAQGLTSSGGLNTSGILSIIRHPWYLAVLLLLWARQLDISTIIINLVFSCYLFIGAYIEEQKMITEFGETYKKYQAKVPMIFPTKGFNRK